jgi:hypothetical protein
MNIFDQRVNRHKRKCFKTHIWKIKVLILTFLLKLVIFEEITLLGENSYFSRAFVKAATICKELPVSSGDWFCQDESSGTQNPSSGPVLELCPTSGCTV